MNSILSMMSITLEDNKVILSFNHPISYSSSSAHEQVAIEKHVAENDREIDMEVCIKYYHYELKSIFLGGRSSWNSWKSLGWILERN